jgi:hypothetical protein
MDDQVSCRQGNWVNVAYESMSSHVVVDLSNLCSLPSLCILCKKCVACWNRSEHPSFEFSQRGGIDVNLSRVDNTLCDPLESFSEVAAVDNTAQKIEGYVGCVSVYGVDLVRLDGFSDYLRDEDSHVMASRDLDQDELGHLLVSDAGLNQPLGGTIWM